MSIGIGIANVIGRSGIGGAGASTAPFAPTDLTGLALWLDANAITPVADGTALAQWNDTSGNNRHAVQASGTKQPLYKTNRFPTGLPAVRFDNTNDCLTIASLNLSAATAVTVFIVTSTITAAADAIILEHSADFNSVAQGFIVYRSSANVVVASTRGAPAGSGSYSDFTTSASTTTYQVTTAPRLIAVEIDKAKTTEEVTTWLNGTYGDIGGTSTGRTNDNNSGTVMGSFALNIGSRNDGAGVPLNGDIGEILLYNRALTAGERADVTAYCDDKYDLFS